jgi:hypothetical protein
MGSAPRSPYPPRETEPSPGRLPVPFLLPVHLASRVFAEYASCKKGAVLNRYRKPKRQALNAPMNTDAVRVKAPGSPGFLIGPGRMVPAERQHFNLVDY